MQKREVVKDNKLFNNIIKTGKWVKNNYFVIYYLESNNEIPKFGIAVGTKIGKAYKRNKYIIIMKRACVELKYAAMEKELKKLIEKVSK